MKTYEEQLAGDAMWALREGSMHFENESKVHDTLLRIARKLDELNVPYAIAGGMALFVHGFRRFTEDVDILTTETGLRTIHDALAGLGYVQPFEGSKNLRDTKTGVRIEFLITGQYPGDGKPKAIAFPDPKDAGVEIEGVRFVGLERLIELKLASGSTAAWRRRDLVDVQDLIRTLKLPRELGDRLDASVREVYGQLWDELAAAPPEEA